jgi:hypothetical protein
MERASEAKFSQEEFLKDTEAPEEFNEARAAETAGKET